MESLSIEELRKIVSTGKDAEKEINRRHAKNAENVEARIAAIKKGDFSQRFNDSELVYAATARCQCGARFAYPSETSMHGAWMCSSILKGEDKALPPTVHDNDLPFAFYSIKSESQPSAYGATTRPAVEVAT